MPRINADITDENRLKTWIRVGKARTGMTNKDIADRTGIKYNTVIYKISHPLQLKVDEFFKLQVILGRYEDEKKS